MYRSILQGLTKTKFINFRTGSPDKMFVDERPIGQIGQNEVIMKVKATGINPAEVLQRQGKYPVNPSIPQQHFLGLEAVGQVFSPQGDKLFDGMALVSGGGYGQYLKVLKSHVMKKPQKMKWSEAAVITEAWLTAYQIIKIGKVKEGSNVAINAATGSVGSAAIQICSLLGANPYVIVTVPEQVDDCKKLGAKGGVSYKVEDWPQQLIAQSEKKGFDVLLDSVFASQFKGSLSLLNTDSTWVLYSFQTGSKLENVDMAAILRKRISLIGTTLKTRSAQYKTQLIQGFQKEILPHFDTNKFSLKIDSVTEMDWNQSNAKPFIDAHDRMQQKKHKGKIVIEYKD